jgi:DNA-directed RNA polymerase subunit F
MMRSSLALLLLPLIFTPAFAQVGNFEINVPQIQEPKKCSEVILTGDKAYIPFQIKVYHDFSRVNDINFEQLGSSIPNTHTSPEVMIFETNFIDEYQIFADVNFDSDKLRAVYIEIWSQNNPSFKEIISFEGLSFCRTFNVRTSEAPTIPTRSELIGEQAERAFEEMPLIKDAINSNTSALGASISWMFIVVVAALGVSAGQFFAYIGRRRKDKKRGTAFDSMIKVGSKYIADFKKEHSEIKNQRGEEKKQMDQFLDMANIEFRTFLTDLRKEGHLPPRASLEIASEHIEEEAEQTSILRKIYESTSDDNLKKFIGYFKNKTGKIAKRHQDLLEEESRKRIENHTDLLDVSKPIKETDPIIDLIEQESIPKPDEILDDEIIPIEDADAIIQELGKERYRNLDDDKMRLLYRAFDAKYRKEPLEKYSHRLYKISEILNLRAKERANGEKE